MAMRQISLVTRYLVFLGIECQQTRDGNPNLAEL